MCQWNLTHIAFPPILSSREPYLCYLLASFLLPSIHSVIVWLEDYFLEE